MRAVYIEAHGGPEALRVGTLPDPVPGPGEVCVSIRAAAINHLDLWVRGGLPGLKLPFPHILGGDAAGIVHSLGAGVTGWKPGDEVIVHPGLSCASCAFCLDGRESLCAEYQILGEHRSGTHAERVCVPVRNLFRKPSAVSFAEAASVPLVFTTAWQMVVRKAGVNPGSVAVVHAAGSGVGSAALQIAKLYGAHVIATAGSEEKLTKARALGADQSICYATEDWVKELRKFAPKGVDVIIDHLGDAQWSNNLRALRSGGTLVLCGATSGFKAETDLRHVFYRQLNLIGSTMGSKGDFPRILRHLESGALRPVVDSKFTLADAPKAFARVAAREVFGKVILEI